MANLPLETTKSEEYILRSALDIIGDLSEKMPLQDMCALCAVLHEITKEGVCYTAELSGVSRDAFMAWLSGIQTRAQEESKKITARRLSQINQEQN